MNGQSITDQLDTIETQLARVQDELCRESSDDSQALLSRMASLIRWIARDLENGKKFRTLETVGKVGSQFVGLAKNRVDTAYRDEDLETSLKLLRTARNTLTETYIFTIDTRLDHTNAFIAVAEALRATREYIVQILQEKRHALTESLEHAEADTGTPHEKPLDRADPRECLMRRAGLYL